MTYVHMWRIHYVAYGIKDNLWVHVPMHVVESWTWPFWTLMNYAYMWSIIIEECYLSIFS